MRRIAFFTALTAVALTAALPFAASAQERVALVVGNGAYAHATKLPNPPNDAADMAAALRELGFKVIAATNADRASLQAKLREFSLSLRSARTVLFYYAGHGMQVAGKNYAIPVDARLQHEGELATETLDVDQVIAAMQSDASRVNLIFLDACRDNPLARSYAQALPASRAVTVGSGLSAVGTSQSKAETSRNILIAFATAPNKVALDGKGRNSPFTAALLKHIRTPDLDIGLIMRRVTADVEAASAGEQSPWVHISLATDVVLARSPAAAPPAPRPAAATKPAADNCFTFNGERFCQ
jgi:uncharacterized caspase-like protein